VDIKGSVDDLICDVINYCVWSCDMVKQMYMMES